MVWTMLLGLGIAGARSFAAVGEWAADQATGALAELEVDEAARPEESAIRRGAPQARRRRLGPGNRGVDVYPYPPVESRRITAVDGKGGRGAKRTDGTMPHLVAAFETTPPAS